MWGGGGGADEAKPTSASSHYSGTFGQGMGGSASMEQRKSSHSEHKPKSDRSVPPPPTVLSSETVGTHLTKALKQSRTFDKQQQFPSSSNQNQHQNHQRGGIFNVSRNVVDGLDISDNDNTDDSDVEIIV